MQLCISFCVKQRRTEVPTSHLVKAARDLLANHVGVGNPDSFTSYTRRRSMPMLAQMRGASEDEGDALGDWLGSKARTTRYSDQRDRVALEVKLVQARIVSDARKANADASWEDTQGFLADCDVQEAKRSVAR